MNMNTIPQLKNKNAVFSRLCSQLSRILWDGNDAFAELSFYGASDCGPLVASSIERDINETLSKFGYIVDSFCDEFETRTTPKELYFSEFGQILQMRQ